MLTLKKREESKVLYRRMPTNQCQRSDKIRKITTSQSSQ